MRHNLLCCVQEADPCGNCRRSINGEFTPSLGPNQQRVKRVVTGNCDWVICIRRMIEEMTHQENGKLLFVYIQSHVQCTVTCKDKIVYYEGELNVRLIN